MQFTGLAPIFTDVEHNQITNFRYDQEDRDRRSVRVDSEHNMCIALCQNEHRRAPFPLRARRQGAATSEECSCNIIQLREPWLLTINTFSILTIFMCVIVLLFVNISFMNMLCTYV